MIREDVIMEVTLKIYVSNPATNLGYVVIILKQLQNASTSRIRDNKHMNKTQNKSS